MVFLDTLRLDEFIEDKIDYPFSVPSLQSIKELKFTTDITYFIGENGSGKSTLLEAIAAAAGSITIGENDIEQDETLHPAKQLSEYFKLSWKINPHKGFFLRSEDMFGFTKRLTETKKELDAMVEEIDRTSTGYGNQLARGAVLGQKAAFENRYGRNLDANSHGETFLKVFKSRFIPGGLYLLDEPETPLSFKRQLSLLVLLQEMVKQNAQFIIATHSPILTAMPDTTIYNFDDGKIEETDYQDIEQFNLMKDFLNNPSLFIKHLK
jgi:predicted ATPase